MTRIIAALGLVLATAMPTSASVILLSGSPVTQNFDSLPVSGTTALSGVLNQVDALPGSTGFVGARIGGSGTAMNIVADDGSSNSGRVGSLGSTGSSDRALGALASGSVIAAFGVEIVNNTGSTISSIQIDAFREQWRSSTSVANTFAFGWAVSGGSATSANFLSDASLAALTSLDLVGLAPVASNGATDGNAAANRAAISGIINASIPNGASLFIRWQDVNDAGNDAVLAVDDMTIRPTLVPEPASLALLVLGGIPLWIRRRS